MTIREAQEEIIEEFKNLNDWIDKYNHLIKLGKDLPPIDSEYIKKDYLVKDCRVTTWIHSTLKDGRVYYDIDSSSMLIRGIIVVLKRILSGQKPEDIVNSDLYFIDKTELTKTCAPARVSDLLKLINKMKLDAASFINK